MNIWCKIIKFEGNIFFINRGVNLLFSRLNNIVFINNLSLLYNIMVLVVKYSVIIVIDCVSLIIFNLFIFINFCVFVLKIV